MPYEKHTPQAHCRRGHEMVGTNVIVRKNGYRRCRACIRLVKRRWAKKVFDEKKAKRETPA
jgi:hypothetical protein